jgi:DNA-binding NtrC family response regulator
MKFIEIFWEIFSWICAILRWLTRRKPDRGIFLIVEDFQPDAEFLQYKLKKLGYDAEIATSGEVAQGLVKHTFYSVCFVDMRLPGMPGEAVVRLLSKETPNTSVIIVCGEPSDLEKLPNDSAVIFVRKPPTLEALDNLLKSLKIRNHSK